MNEGATLADPVAPLPSQFSPAGVGREEMVVKDMCCAELWPHQIPDTALGMPGLGQEGEEP